MANYCGKSRTNYFSVTDEEKFREIMASCRGDDDVVVFDNEDEDNKKFGFYCDGSIQGLPDPPLENESDEEDFDCDISYNLFCESLQGILPDGEAIIITEVGNEKMRYLTGCCSVITKTEIIEVDLRTVALERARSALGNPNFATQMEY